GSTSEVINSATLFIRTMRLSSMGAVTHGTLSCGCPTSSSPLPNASMHRLKYRAPGITDHESPRVAIRSLCPLQERGRALNLSQIRQTVHAWTRLSDMPHRLQCSSRKTLQAFPLGHRELVAQSEPVNGRRAVLM